MLWNSVFVLFAFRKLITSVPTIIFCEAGVIYFIYSIDANNLYDTAFFPDFIYCFIIVLFFSIYFLIHILRCLLSTLVLHALISLLYRITHEYFERSWNPFNAVNSTDTEGLDRIDGMSDSQSPQMEKEGCLLWGKLEHRETSFHPQKCFNLWA